MVFNKNHAFHTLLIKSSSFLHLHFVLSSRLPATGTTNFTAIFALEENRVLLLDIKIVAKFLRQF